MNRMLRSTVAVLVITALTALSLFTAVSISGRITGTGSASAAYATTGTTANTAAYTTGTNAIAVSSSSGNQTLTCPRTGCTASYCHATQGRRP